MIFARKKLIYGLLFFAVTLGSFVSLSQAKASAQTELPGDINSDGVVNIMDVSILLANYSKTRAQASNPNADVNNDNVINIFDVSILLGNYGKTSVPSTAKLNWAPPAQTNPTVVNVPTTGISRTFAATEDAILVLPSSVVTGQIGTTGGRHIRIIGGKIGGGSATFSGTYAIVARDLRGSIFIEGIDNDFSQLTDKDNITVTGYSPKGTNRVGWTYPSVYIQNSRIMGSKWSGGSFHPDIYQKQGAQGTLYMDKVTAEASYQGLQVSSTTFSSGPAPQELYVEGLNDMEVRRTNLRHRADHTVGYLAWFAWDAGQNGSFTGEDPFPIRLSDFWVEGIPGHTLGSNLLWPRVTTTQGENGQDPHMILAPDGLSATWTAASLITGTARKGNPPGGDFVPANSVGIGYVSPGYN